MVKIVKILVNYIILLIISIPLLFSQVPEFVTKEDKTSDPEGDFLALKASESVCRLYKIKGLKSSVLPAVNKPDNLGKLGFHILEGKHDFTSFDRNEYLNFADKHLQKY